MALATLITPSAGSGIRRLMRYAGLALPLLLAVSLAPAADAAEFAPPAYAGSSADGKVVFFTTAQQLVPGDTDRRIDLYDRTYDREPGIERYVTRELSTGPTGGNAAYDVTYDGASADGTKVFFSTAESLVPGDTDHSEDIYMRNLKTNETILVSQGESSCQASGCGNGPDPAKFVGASADGTKVFFVTNEQLSPQDTDGAYDVYMRNLTNETTTLVSQGESSCQPGCGNGSHNASFDGASENGDKVFFSTEEQLSAAPTNKLTNIYERNLASNPPTTTLVSGGGTCPAGIADPETECVAVYRGASPDGSHVYFQTDEQISPQDTDESTDVYAWSGGTTTLVSQGQASCAPTCGNGPHPATYLGASADGTKVFFQTDESLSPKDTDKSVDIYMRNLETNETILVSQGQPTCAPGCGNGPLPATYRGASADGTKVFFETDESLSPQDTNEATDVYMRDLVSEETILVSQGESSCAPGCGNGPDPARFAGATPDGTKVFFSTKESLSPLDTDESTDIYMRNLTNETTTLETPAGTCPLTGEKGCDASFDGASEDGTHVFFTSAKRLTAEDLGSEPEIYERADEEIGGQPEWTTRLISVGNSLPLGPPTPILTATDPASPAASTTPSLIGEAEANSSIKVYSTPDCSGVPVATGTAAQLGVGIEVPVAAGSTTSFRATATDSSGDTSSCSEPLTYRQAAESNGGGGGPSEGGGTGGGSGGGAGGSGLPPVPKPPTPPTPRGPVAPQTRITFAPGTKTRLRRPVFGFIDASGQSGTAFVCKLDHSRWKRCRSPQRTKRLRRGRHLFEVKGVNSGIWELRPVKRHFKVVPR